MSLVSTDQEIRKGWLVWRLLWLIPLILSWLFMYFVLCMIHGPKKASEHMVQEI